MSLVIHGRDVARAIGQPYDCDDAELDVVNGFVAQIASAVALSGRDPRGTAR